MTDTWPTDRPGVPLHAERDGWHWLMIGHGVGHPFPMLWCADGEMWEAGDDGYVAAADISTRWNYLGPLYTQADLDAAVQAEREAIAKWHDGRATIYRVTAARLTGMNRDSFDGYARKEQDAADYIRSRGPTPALDAALAQARQETWEKAAVIAETLRDGNPSAIAGTAWWGTKIAAAIRLAAAQEGGKS